MLGFKWEYPGFIHTHTHVIFMTETGSELNWVTLLLDGNIKTFYLKSLLLANIYTQGWRK